MAPVYPYIASTLERSARASTYDPQEIFFYKEDKIDDCQPVTEENYKYDKAIKLARVVKEI